MHFVSTLVKCDVFLAHLHQNKRKHESMQVVWSIEESGARLRLSIWGEILMPKTLEERVALKLLGRLR